MPYNCEDCGSTGAKMKTLFEIRLCDDCSQSFKYKLISKSKVIDIYKLTPIDLANNNLLNYQIKEYYCKNPHYKSGPPMTLYLESDIQKIFLRKYSDIIQNKLQIVNNNIDPSQIENLVQIEQIVSMVTNYLNKIKMDLKKNKFDKILKKLNVDYISLPNWVKNSLNKVKNGVEYEFVLTSYIRFRNIYKILSEHGLKKYIDHKICHDYIYQNFSNNLSDVDYINNPEQIPNLISFMLNKKKLLKDAIKQNNLPIKKYKNLYLTYMNSLDTSNNLSINNDLNSLVNYIKNKEFRLIDLETKLKSKGLELRSDSVLCSRYLEGSDEYTSDEIVNIMEQMNWFFTCTNYSVYCREYDQNKRNSRYNNYYNDHYYSDSDSDSDYEYKQKQKENYNKIKSEFVKKQCIKEWIKNGKKGILPPESLNYFIQIIEDDLYKFKKLKS